MTIPNQSNEYDRLLTIFQVADRLGVTPKTMHNWATRGIGPAKVKLNARVVRYRLSDVEDFINSRTMA